MASNTIAAVVLTKMRKDWVLARQWLQASQGWPDTDCNDVSTAIAEAVEAKNTEALTSWSLWLASKAAEARQSGFERELQEAAHKQVCEAERVTARGGFKMFDGIRGK
jgi:hypothetical protein